MDTNKLSKILMALTYKVSWDDFGKRSSDYVNNPSIKSFNALQPIALNLARAFNVFARRTEQELDEFIDMHSKRLNPDHFYLDLQTLALPPIKGDKLIEIHGTALIEVKHEEFSNYEDAEKARQVWLQRIAESEDY